jgi:hypothetical protein
VYEAMRGWAAIADPAEPDQDFWDFVCTQDTLPAEQAAQAHRRFAAHGVRGRLILAF